MMDKATLFWNRILELASESLGQTTYDFFVIDAKLKKITQDKVYIFLDSEIKKVYWEKNIEPFVLTAGFEIFNRKLDVAYLFTDDELTSEKEKAAPEEIEELINSTLNTKYTFSNFVQGDGNMWAKAASLAVSENLGGIYNPLFIYGGPGLGKTHLLNAIGNAVLNTNPRARVKYVSADMFINDFLEHLRLNKMDEFKKLYRSLDLLLIDDIQALSNKVTTQEEFFNTFNALHDNNKQIVLTSDRNPDDLKNLEERLVTRFKWGLTSDITPPDFETRIAILKNKLEAYDFIMTNEAIEYLAGQFDSNVRELEGALKNINLVATARQVQQVTVELTSEAIEANKKTTLQSSVIPIRTILEKVGSYYGVTVKDLKGSKKTQNIAFTRQIAMFISREMTDNSLPKIGKEFGGRDHSTVLYAYKKIKKLYDVDNAIHSEIDELKKMIKQ